MSSKAGRPTVITPKIVSLLVRSFHKGMNIREACWQSGISHESYYNRLRSDEYFTDIMSKAQSAPTAKAKMVVIQAIDDGDIGASKWWLERKANDEFSNSPKLVTQPEPKHNPFENMSDEEMDKLGVELSKLMQSDH